jgi:serine protease inhibitor
MAVSLVIKKEKKMRKPIYLFFIAAIIPALFLSACGPGKAAVNVAASNLSRIENQNIPVSDQEQLVAGNTAFAFDLYQAVRASNGNLVYSPYSISLAFAMAYGGAAGETARQMAEVLHYSLPPAQFHPAFNGLDLDLARRPTQSAYVDEKERFQFSIANSTWAQEDYSFLPAYLDLLALNYGAGMQLVDFKKAPEAARRQINDWVSKQTNQRIQDILPEGSVESRTRLVLANAIFFKAYWGREFNPGFTNPGPFHLLDGSTVNVPMMQKHPEEDYAYAAGDGWKAVSLPYKGGLADMVILLPDEGTFNTFEASLTAEKYQAVVSALQSQRVILSLPKFKFEADLGLKDALVRLGMQDAFTENVADLSGMDGTHLLYLGDAFHKAFIAVDEKGTEAAAATGVLAVPASGPVGADMQINRPFLFFIRDMPSGTVLFMGRVLDPR